LNKVDPIVINKPENKGDTIILTGKLGEDLVNSKNSKNLSLTFPSSGK